MHRSSPRRGDGVPLLPLAAGVALGLLAAGVTHSRRSYPPRDTRLDAAPLVRPDAVAPDLPIPANPIWREAPQRTARLAPIGVAIAVILASAGVSFVGIAMASQRSASQTPVPAPEAQATTGRAVEAWPSRSNPAEVASALAVPPTAAPDTGAHTLATSLPVALRIPAIGVRSPLRHLGQAADGSMETPQPGPYYNDAAWYRHSPTPGSLGPAILLGHVDSAAEGPSVFFRLGELTAGDDVAVTRADGSVAVFSVDRVRRYAKDSFPTELVYGNIEHAGLRLVTCGGAFDNASGHYLDNVVVFASLKG